MNRHIEEIAEIANGLALAEFNDVSLRRFRLYREIYDTKFANLIFLECQKAVDNYISECGEVSSLPESVLKKHFGFK